MNKEQIRLGIQYQPPSPEQAVQQLAATPEEVAFSYNFSRLADKDHRVNAEVLARLSTDFYRSVASSGNFSWLSLFETEDMLQRQCLVLYLQERISSQGEALPDRQQVGVGAIGPRLSELSLALPEIDLDFYLYRSGDDEGLAERCQQDINLRYGGENYIPPTKLLYETTFPVRPQNGR
jgi:hypothetical protein